MATDANIPDRRVRPRNLWFGFAGSAFSWVLLGCLDIIITLLGCTHQAMFGIPSDHPNVAILFIAISVLLLAVTLAAGVTSYRNWRHLSSQPDMLDSLGVERREFMAIIGVIVSITLGMGIIWLALPPFFLDLCWRAK